MMKNRRSKAVIALVAATTMFAVSCGDKIQAAKTVLAFVNLGITTVDGAFDTYAAAKRAECLKQGAEGTDAYNKCYEATKKLMEKWALIEPKLQKSAETAASYVKAAESGQTADYATAVKDTVCLLTEVYNIIPDKGWESIKKKIKMYVDLAGAYACTKTAFVQPDPEREYKLLKLATEIYKDILGKKFPTNA